MFEIGKVYKRSDLHDLYGGNRQGGIANSANHPLIFVFSGSSGLQYGYSDDWDEENYYHYSGEGQHGDMTFAKGNLSLRDHVKNGKNIYLFEFEKKAFWKFIDELELIDYYFNQTPDSDGIMRKGIRFKFKSATEKSVNKSGERRESENYNKPNKTERRGLVASRVGKGWYRQAILDRWDNKCAVTGFDIEEILIESHIVPWKESTNEERLDVDNGLLLSPDLDALFDRHLITFDDNGTIKISKEIDAQQYKLLGIDSDAQISNLSAGNKKYLLRHRAKFAEKTKTQ